MNAAIDIHTHVVPAQFPAYRGNTPGIAWPAMEHDGCGHANVTLSGKFFRTVEQCTWDLDARRRDIIDMAIGRQVLSPMPELLSYWLPAQDARLLLRHVNTEIAAMVSTDPAHMIGMGAVPLQDVAMAIVEMRHAREVLGLQGIEIGSNIDGVPLGDARFEPFFAAAEAMDIPLFVHAIRAAGKERLVGLPLLEQIVGFPGETGLAIAGLVTGGTLARHPRLRIAFSHGGGTVAMLLARMQHFWETLPRFADTLAEAPAVTASRLFYDTVVFDPAIVRLLADRFGAGQLLIGSDYPFGGYERNPCELLMRAGFDQATVSAIAEDNPRRYLGLKEKVQ